MSLNPLIIQSHVRYTYILLQSKYCLTLNNLLFQGNSINLTNILIKIKFNLLLLLGKFETQCIIRIVPSSLRITALAQGTFKLYKLLCFLSLHRAQHKFLLVSEIWCVGNPDMKSSLNSHKCRNIEIIYVF